MQFKNTLFNIHTTGYSEIFFMQGTLPGALLLCISFLNYPTAITGGIAVISAVAFAKLIGHKSPTLSTYNILLAEGRSVAAALLLG